MPAVDIPHADTVVKVAIVDNGARISGPLSFFMEPNLFSPTAAFAPAYVFLVEHPTSKRRLVFDLGIRKHIEEYPPSVLAYHHAFTIKPGEEIFEMLPRHGVELSTIEAVIWSHHHIDHIGNPAGFLPSTDLIVGPGFKDANLPGYPADPDAKIRESDYEGRNLREVDFDIESLNLTVGGYRAVDYFGDGSFYLLETSGHTIDHLAALARVSLSPSRFILMGADTGQHAAEWRPSEHLPLPKELSPSPLGPDSKLNIRPNFCLGELFVEHVHPERSDRVPFLRIKAGHPYDVDQARESLKKMEAFDADENILVIAAHDYTLLPFLTYFPEWANDWHTTNLKELSRWVFLEDFADIVREKAEGDQL